MVTIEPITAADFDEWLPLWQAYLVFYEAELDEATTHATFERVCDPASAIHGAFALDAASTPVGLVHWLTHASTWSTADYCYLEDLFVSPAARRTGAGAALIDHVRAWASERDLEKVYWLTAESNSTARSLYDAVATRTGFTHYEVGAQGLP
ncbi:MAG TPA: GNAT family N-acetyltransferase [Terrimesophilobacter sp.]|nr:GNAT family N-acetyltransferase [Terrimesophilobacter sp.]